jgi:hypothetical protein
MRRVFQLTTLATILIGGCFAGGGGKPCRNCYAADPAAEYAWAASSLAEARFAWASAPNCECGGKGEACPCAKPLAMADKACPCGVVCPAGGSCSNCICAAPGGTLTLHNCGNATVSIDGYQVKSTGDVRTLTFQGSGIYTITANGKSHDVRVAAGGSTDFDMATGKAMARAPVARERINYFMPFGGGCAGGCCGSQCGRR